MAYKEKPNYNKVSVFRENDISIDLKLLKVNRAAKKFIDDVYSMKWNYETIKRKDFKNN